MKKKIYELFQQQFHLVSNFLRMEHNEQQILKEHYQTVLPIGR